MFEPALPILHQTSLVHAVSIPKPIAGTLNRVTHTVTCSVGSHSLSVEGYSALLLPELNGQGFSPTSSVSGISVAGVEFWLATSNFSSALLGEKNAFNQVKPAMAYCQAKVDQRYIQCCMTIYGVP